MQTVYSKFLLTLCLFSLFAPAEEKKSEIWKNIKSPITTDARYSLLFGTGLTLTLLVLEDQVIDPAQEETVENKPLGSSSSLGDQLGQVYPNAAYVLGFLGYGYIAHNPQAFRNASLMFQSTLYSSVVTTALKYTIREPRPNNGNKRNSFPSGHSTTIFAFASYIGCAHSLPWGIAAYTAAGFVAFSRMNDNAHYIHDVTGGAAIGTAYGLGVCMAEQERVGKQKPIETIGYLSPLEQGIAVGLSHSF